MNGKYDFEIATMILAMMISVVIAIAFAWFVPVISLIFVIIGALCMVAALVFSCL